MVIFGLSYTNYHLRLISPNTLLLAFSLFTEIRESQKKGAKMKKTNNKSGDTALTAEEDEKYLNM